MVLDNDFQLGEWLVKPHTNMIEGPDGDAHLEPKAMQVLALLAQRSGEVVQKQEILEDVWDGSYVSDEVLPNAIWELRKALGDDARKPRFIQTLPKKGYRLIAPVDLHVGTVDASAEAGPPQHSRTKTLIAAVAALVSGGLAAFLLSAHSSDANRASTDGPYSVLVMSFENHTDADHLAWLSSGAPTMLRTGLTEIAGIQVVSPERLERALADVEDHEEDDESIARRAGADTIVRGSIFKLGEDYRIDVQIEDVADAEIFAAHSVRGDDVFLLMDDLTAWVSESLGAGGGRAGAPVRPIAEMTTSSLDAFRLYNAGVTARRNLRLADAHELLSEAVEIDPNFALAYLELSWVAMTIKDEAAYEALTARVSELKDQLPVHRQQLLDGAALWNEDPVAAEQILLDVVERFPEDVEAYMQLVYLYKESYQQDKASELLKRGTIVMPHADYLRLNYGYQLLSEGRYPEAIHQLEVYARLKPEEANPRDSLGEAYLIAGVPERALEEYGKALAIDNNFPSAHVGRSWAYSQTGRFQKALDELDAIQDELPPGYTDGEMQFMKGYFLTRAGRFHEADDVFREIALHAEETGNATLLAMTHLFDSLVQLEKGAPTEGLAAAEKASEVLPAEARNYRSLHGLAELLLGISSARMGDSSQAQQHLLALQECYEPRNVRERWWYHLLLGETLLARGDARGAYNAFTAGTPRQKMPFNVIYLLQNVTGALSFRDGAARAKALAGETREAIAIYEKLLRPDIGQKWIAPLEPRYHLEIARLHRELGERELALRHYQQVLSLWSTADAQLPEIVEAEQFLTTS